MIQVKYLEEHLTIINPRRCVLMLLPWPLKISRVGFPGHSPLHLLALLQPLE